ncbi:CobW family GTP-binding protein [Maribellus sp. YY47]|uniref:CobW family GTP-binding protein n=1 Tax=Maribellus sp. YY47 TaxID=2929486 RepID=UPI002001BB5C|nr:CobW family GTP-binding protein [Maribellus sp. YY47]MCK3683678.1 CobW family GTP-binding protein [Maribellus sp. YY47]
MNKIPLHIVSGFLGSGKTTFLKRIIEQNASKLKIGIVQNEFAPSNIDGMELRKCGGNFQLLEFKNGSVFCDCLLGDFSRSLERFVDEHQPDVVIVEASGLSDTTSVAEVLSSGQLAEKVFLASNCCIVDAGNFGKVGLMRQRVNHQLRMADLVVVNKTDLARNDTDNLLEEIKKINPFAEIRSTSFCQIDFQWGVGTISKFYPDEVQGMPRPAVNSMVIKTKKEVSEAALLAFLNEWAPKAYRIKGYVKMPGQKVAAVQCTFDKVSVTKVDDDFLPTELVALSDQFSLRDWSRAFRELPRK